MPHPAEAPPSDLARRIRAGSADALGELYARSAPRLFAIARRLTGSREDAEDVLHDVFLGLPEALRRYDDSGVLDHWLSRVTTRVALMRLRSGRRRREVDIPPTLEAPRRAAPVDRVSLEHAIDALPDPLRVVLVLKMIDGYSHAEIASLLDITPRASEQRLYRALSALREQARQAEQE
jgi:RNA polymerase sigma-70 factor (ECF subfamily)